MKYCEFVVSPDRIIVLSPSKEELEKIKEGLQKAGIAIDDEWLSLCG